MGTLTPPITDVVTLPSGGRMLLGEWPGADLPIVAIPGLTSHHRFFSGIAVALRGERRIVSLDLRGRGCSTAAERPGMESHADDVLAAMDAAGVGRALLAGHSMGAFVAIEVARRAPERVAGICLLDGGVVLPGEDDPKEIEALIEPMLARLSAVYPSVSAYVDLWRSLSTFGRDWNPIFEQYVEYDLGRVRDGYSPKGDATACTADLFDDALLHGESRRRLGELRCPIVAIGAERGILDDPAPVIAEPHAALLHKLGLDAELVVVPNTDHHTITLSDAGAAGCADALRSLAARAGA